MAEESDKKFNKLSSHFTPDMIKTMADSIGVGGLPDAAARYLAEDVTYRMKQIIQEAAKFKLHGRRRTLTTDDVDNTLYSMKVAPQYGFSCAENIPFRMASGGGRELYFTEDQEIECDELTAASSSAKVPWQPSIRAHWLAIDGEQPTLPENPAPVGRDEQKEEGFDPSLKHKVNKAQGELQNTKVSSSRTERCVVKEISTHELSVEQQLYYKEITEACVGSDEVKRQEALTSLAQDTGLHQMLPRLTTFISEGVRVNIVGNNLALLIYLMRMIKSLMENTNLYLEKYLHEILPAVMSCVVSKQLCARPDVDNHWALRDFAAKQLAQICKAFHSSTNDIQTRVTKMFTDILSNERAALATHYGAVSGLNELGADVVKTVLLPFVKNEGDRLKTILEGPVLTSAERIAAEHVKITLSRYVANCLKVTKPNVMETLDEVVAEFGYLGPVIHSNLIKLRAPGAVVTARAGPTLGIPVAPSRPPQVIIQQTQTLTRTCIANINPRLW